MCQRDINRFLYEPFLAIALSQDRKYKKNVLLYGVLQNVVSGFIFLTPWWSFPVCRNHSQFLQENREFFCVMFFFEDQTRTELNYL